MSATTLYLPFSNASATLFRQWGEGISLQLTAAGWTKTADTGQVDWTTDPSPPANGSWVYEIRTPASDPLQTGASAIVTYWYYGTNGSGAPRLRVAVAHASDGAGNLVAPVLGPIESAPSYQSSSAGTTPYDCHFSWDASRLGIMLWRTHGGDGATDFIGIERTKNSDGTDSAEGVTLIHTDRNNSNTGERGLMRTLLFVSGLAQSVKYCAIWPGVVTSLAFNHSIPMSPIFPSYGKFANPMTIVAALSRGDAVEGALYRATIYGQEHTYLVSRSDSMNCFGPAYSMAMAMRYD